MEIRFKTLPSLINDMKKQVWIIDSFRFKYKNLNYIVILKLYKENERKPQKYAQAKLEFIKEKDTKQSIFAYADYYEVYFSSVAEFANFFDVKIGDAKRDLFLDFSEKFATAIPKCKIVQKNDSLLTRLQGSRAEGSDPEAIYCYDIRRSGITKTGENKIRSVENSNKAETLRPFLFDKYKDDSTLSFYFTSDKGKELSDAEIMNNVSKR